MSLSIVLGMPTTGTSRHGGGGPHRALAADHDEPVERVPVDRPPHELRTAVDPGRLRARCPEDRAAPGKDPPDVLRRELHRLARRDPSPPVAEPEHTWRLDRCRFERRHGWRRSVRGSHRRRSGCRDASRLRTKVRPATSSAVVVLLGLAGFLELGGPALQHLVPLGLVGLDGGGLLRWPPRPPRPHCPVRCRPSVSPWVDSIAAPHPTHREGAR